MTVFEHIPQLSSVFSNPQDFMAIHVCSSMLVFHLREVCYLFIFSLAHFVLACVPFIAIRLSAAIALFARALSVPVCKFEASAE